jgi:hypothetical protein
MNRKCTITAMHSVSYCDNFRELLTRYVRSLVLLTDCDHYVFGDIMPRWLEGELWQVGAEILRSPSTEEHGEYVGPETVAKWLRERNEWVESSDYDTYICQGCKGSYFQADVPHMTGLHLTCEGMKFRDSTWNITEAYKFDPEWARGIENLDVINGGCQIGDRESFLRYCRAEVALPFIPRGCTNQPAVNWLVRTGQMPCTLHHPLSSDLCLTGEPCRLAGRLTNGAKLVNGVYVDQGGRPYKIVRQAYRIPEHN